MSAGPGDPWANPATETQAGPPYAGPPMTGPAPYGPPTGYGYPGPGYAPAGYAPPGYGPPGFPPAYPGPGYPAPPPWAWAPSGPRRPGQVVTAAVLAFVQAAVVIIASLYLYLLVSVARLAASAGTGFSIAGTGALVAEGRTLLVVQLVSAVALVVAGVWALNRRSRAAWAALLVSFAVQVVLAVYWAVRLSDADGGSGADGVLSAFTIFFFAAPLVGLGLLLSGPGRRWFAERTDGATPA